MSKSHRKRPTGRADSNDAVGYKVGYRKPPVHSRFKPGQSGNPQGRPKRKRVGKMQQELQEVYLREIMVLDNGKKRRVPGIVLLIQKLLADGLKGDRQAALASYKFAQQLGVPHLEWEEPELDLNLTKEEDQKITEAFLILHRARHNAGIGSD